MRIKTVAPVVLILCFSAASIVAAQRPKPKPKPLPPFSLEDIELQVRTSTPADRLLEAAGRRCISFQVNDASVSRLRSLGASSILIDGLKTVCVQGQDIAAPPTTSSDQPTQPIVVPQAPTPAPAPPPPDTGKSIKITAGLLAADQITLRPVPLLALAIVGPGVSDTTRVQTDFQGIITHTLKDGEYQVAASKFFVNPNDTTWVSWRVPFKVPGTTEVILSNINAKTEAVHPIIHIAPEKAVTEYARHSIFQVLGTNEKANGFLADTAGLVVTNAHLWTDIARLPTDEALVMIDSVTKVRARIVALDSAPGHDVAVLAINMKRCGSCRALHVADSARSPIVSVQDKVLAMQFPSARVPLGYNAALVSRLDRTTMTTTEMSATCGAGGPLIAMDSVVVGVSTCRAGAGGGSASGTATTANVALPLLQQARDLRRAGKLATSDTLIWTYPAQPFPLEAQQVYAGQDFDWKRYAFNAGDWRVFVMTPPVAYWRQKKAETTLIEKHESGPFIDPIQGWHGWDEFLQQRHAAIIINVIPKELNYPHDNLHETETSDRLFATMRLLRQGVEVTPIERARLNAALNVDEYRTEGKTMPLQGVFVYRDRDFAPLAPGRDAPLTIEIVDARNPDKVMRVDIPPELVKRIQDDFVAYRMGGASDR